MASMRVIQGPAARRNRSPIDTAYDVRKPMVISYVVPCAAVNLRGELAHLRASRRSVRPERLDALLTAAGFARRHGKGDHWVYTHARRPFPLTIDPRNPLLPAYFSKAIRAIEEVLNDDEDD